MSFMWVEITYYEGGMWCPIVTDRYTVINFFMHPHNINDYPKIIPAAIRFENGIIYDNVLAALHQWPWRTDRYMFKIWKW